MSAEALVAARRFEALRTELPVSSPRAWRFAALALASRASAVRVGGNADRPSPRL